MPRGGAADDLDGHFDHVLGLQFPGGNAVEHVRRVGFGVRRRGEFDDAGGVESLQHVEGKERPGVVRLVHDDRGAVDRQQVLQREDRGAGLLVVLDFGQAFFRDMFEMGRQSAVAVLVDPQSFLAVPAERLKRGNDDAGPAGNVRKGHGKGFVDVLYDDVVQGRVQTLTIRMVRISQGGEGLGQDRRRGDQPQNDGGIGPLELPDGEGDRPARHERLAAPGGDPETDVGDLFQVRFVDLPVRTRGSESFGRLLIEGRFRRAQLVAGCEIILQGVQRPLLILFQPELTHDAIPPIIGKMLLAASGNSPVGDWRFAPGGISSVGV